VLTNSDSRLISAWILRIREPYASSSLPSTAFISTVRSLPIIRLAYSISPIRACMVPMWFMMASRLGLTCVCMYCLRNSTLLLKAFSIESTLCNIPECGCLVEHSSHMTSSQDSQNLISGWPCIIHVDIGLTSLTFNSSCYMQLLYTISKYSSSVNVVYFLKFIVDCTCQNCALDDWT
jgi:hypothetical protein